jgi:hypothetical protein
MVQLLTDAEIAEFISEAKPLKADFLLTTQLKPKRGHEEAEVAIMGTGGHEFQIRVRRSLVNPMGYNGNNHEHTNRIEKTKFTGYHIHLATERYQLVGGDEDGYAETTDRYYDVHGALQCLVDDCACTGSLGSEPVLPF